MTTNRAKRKRKPVRFGRLWLALIVLGILFPCAPILLGVLQAYQEPPPPPEVPEAESGEVMGKPIVFRLPITGTIDLGLAPFVSRVVEEAAHADNGVVLLDIDTFGGRVDAAVLIRDALIDAPVRTIAFINPRAISAGALISLACEDIVITSGGTIGAATPITTGGKDGPEAADEKFMSYMRTEMRATAERRGRRGDVAEAMVDPDVEVEGVSAKGKVLTLTTEDAIRVKIADMEVDDLEDALEKLGLGDATIEEREPNWAETIARAISEPAVSSLLLSIGFLGIIIELYQPGWGIPGTLGAIALLAFFFGHQVVQLAGWEELLLFGLGMGLLLLEVLVIPGFGFVGFSGIALILVSVLMSLLALDLQVSWDLGFVQPALTVLGSAFVLTTVLAAILVAILPASGATRRLVLSRTLGDEEGAHDEATEQAFPLGSRGEAITDLRPAGKIRIEGKRLNAVTEGGYVDAGAPVVILEWRTGTAVVRAQPAETDDPA